MAAARSVKKKDAPEYEPVDASPVKSFFVHMLTRDIELEEAILDLLDNCVDGILRSKRRRSAKEPYNGFWAEIKYDKHTFEISDNCGGIPWGLHDYAFRMGRSHDRPPDPAGAVGVYGIGMKRAIFKMGEECLISTQNGRHRYEVDITPKWIRDENAWRIPVTQAQRTMKHDGTTIVIESLYSGIAARFGADEKAFTSKLEQMIATHYAFIIEKGFCVKINGRSVTPQPTRLIFARKPGGKGAPAIRPFLFKAAADGVKVFLAVGFTRPIPSQDEAAEDQRETRYSSIDAGWTVLCNDRAVLYCDRSELTGWGEAGVPRYHTQFIAISGIVEFCADDASKLPTTTTKRGIDASSSLYLQVKNKMREGMKVFIDYTNNWKGRADEAKTHMGAGEPLSFVQIKAEAERLPLIRTRRAVPKGEQYMPHLPLPKRLGPRHRRISFTRDVADVRCVAEYLFNDESADPCAVGKECFDRMLGEARK